MKPVTELYEAAESAYRGAGDRRLGEAVLKFDIDMGDEHEPNRDMLEVLDLVATLPPERLGLVRWVAGLSVEQLGEVQGLLEMGTAEAKKRGYSDWEKGVAYGAEFMRAAFSGGEGGAKCQECHGTGKVKRVEGGGSIRVVKYDPCPKCTAGRAVMVEGSAPTTLPAGKPPPFLRVGMVLAGKRDHSWTVESIHQDARAVLRGGGEVRVRAIKDILEQCILFEPFTVEGES